VKRCLLLLTALVLGGNAFAWSSMPVSQGPLSDEARAEAARKFAEWQRRNGAGETPVPAPEARPERVPASPPAPAPQPRAEAAPETSAPEPVPEGPAAEAAPAEQQPQAEAAPPPPRPVQKSSFFRRPMNPDRSPIRHGDAAIQW
jgi:hypothetical protein